MKEMRAIRSEKGRLKIVSMISLALLLILLSAYDDNLADAYLDVNAAQMATDQLSIEGSTAYMEYHRMEQMVSMAESIVRMAASIAAGWLLYGCVVRATKQNNNNKENEK